MNSRKSYFNIFKENIVGKKCRNLAIVLEVNNE